MLILHHLGLGDHIICHGLVREICESNKDDIVHIFCKPHNEVPVRFMFQDIPNLDILIGYDNDAWQFKRDNENTMNCIEVGFSKMDLNSGESFDWQFYQHANVPFDKRWDNFKVKTVQRLTQQSEVFKNYKERFGIKKGNYIFVHDDESRGLSINPNNLPPDAKIVRPEKGITDNIFDFYMLIRYAKEVHCMDSSFKNLIESMFMMDSGILSHFGQPDLYYHTYVRGNSPMFVSQSRCNWRVIKE
tara:strand:+ start:5236 stop:5970 length:735 start_codon:yes stop_codon:yes gene_type:complete